MRAIGWLVTDLRQVRAAAAAAALKKFASLFVILSTRNCSRLAFVRAEFVVNVIVLIVLKRVVVA
jgi:hypothetical protein